MLLSLATACWSAPRKVQLDRCHVLVYTFGAQKLHAFATNDALDDECFIIEGRDAMAAIEMPSMTEDLRVWRDYVASLDKPLTDIFVCAHPGGAAFVKDARVIATRGAARALSDDVWQRAIVGQIEDQGWSQDKAEITDVIKSEQVRAAGMIFDVTEAGSTYTISIPSMNAVYTHLFGADTHSIFLSAKDIDAMIGEARDFLDSGYTMILSAHHEPEGRAAVRQRINTLEAIKDILFTSEDADEYVERMKAAFPNMKGENFLRMSAAIMFAPRR